MPVSMRDLYVGDIVKIVKDKRGRRLPGRLAYVKSFLSRPLSDGRCVYVESGFAHLYLAHPDSLVKVADGNGQIPADGWSNYYSDEIVKKASETP